MSKNNDEIVESVLPKPLFKEEDFDGVFVRNKDIGYLKQALTEKKLCVPCRQEENCTRTKVGRYRSCRQSFLLPRWTNQLHQ